MALTKSKKSVIISFVLAFAACVTILPLIFTAINSLVTEPVLNSLYETVTSNAEASVSISFFWSLDNYLNMLLLTPDYLIKFWISLLLVSVIVIGHVIVSCLAGYGFSKFSFPGKSLMLFSIIILMIMPIQVVLVPQYLTVSYLGLLGSYSSLILPGWFAAFGIFLMTQVYQRFPDDIIEAARSDGAGELRILWSIVVPNSTSGLSSLIILSFIDNWNMVEQPLVMLGDYRKYPISVFLSYLNEHNLGIAFACGVLAMLPSLVLFLFFKEDMIKGIEYASVK